jgi:murein DD-endopeptidase MepM/ murein hydrolase activator NlpD
MVSTFKGYCENKKKFILPFDDSILKEQYCALDLSISNSNLESIEITNPDECQNYIDCILQRNHAVVAYGGYLEKRNIYRDKSSFTQKEDIRNIHLGVDFWAKAGTTVITPLKGKVHSFQNNDIIGDYGPTIILQHHIEDFVFHTLYGHLSLESIDNLKVGQVFKKGDELATLGTPDVNVNYAPHLHFQIIIDMEGMKGDYPGVCSEERLDFYTTNCPDPNLLLNI